MAITKTGQDQLKGRRFLVLFFSIFMIFGLAMTAVFLYPLVQIARASDWREVPCTILASRVETHSGTKGGATYSVEVSYEYVLDEQRHVGSRYKFMSGSSSGYDGKKAIVDRLSPGSQTVCYVNRRDADDSVIERGFTSDMLFGFIPMIFSVIGAGGLIGVLIRRRKPTMPGAAPGIPAAALAGPAPATRGAASLKTSSSPTTRFGCSVVFALFWNTVVGVFAGGIWSSWRSGQADGCTTLFLIPFVLVGLGLIVLSLYFFLSLFNPRPDLQLSSTSVALGDTVELEWKTAGNVDRVKSFTITLEGREEATYRRGTSTSTDKSTFLVIPLAHSARGKDLRHGKAKFTVPADSMHSFKSLHNKFVWLIQVKGDIPRWPDIGEEYPLEVLPLRSPSGGPA
jgi:hypothetical protein